MVQIKNGKPVVPGANDPRNRDIGRPKMDMSQKVGKVMKVPTEKIANDKYVQSLINNGSNIRGSQNG